MYRPPLFKMDDPAALRRLMREQSFAMLVTAPGAVPAASHIPLFLDTDGGGNGRLLGHVAKANPQWREFDGETEALAIFRGPHAYVSPSWYETGKSVPTWNYVTVHAYGKPRIMPDPDDARAVLGRLVSVYESEATGPWSMDRLPDTYVDKQLKGIVAFEMPIDRLEGKFKLSQDRSEADRAGVIRGLEGSDDPEAREVARLVAESEDAG